MKSIGRADIFTHKFVFIARKVTEIRNLLEIIREIKPVLKSKVKGESYYTTPRVSQNAFWIGNYVYKSSVEIKMSFIITHA